MLEEASSDASVLICFCVEKVLGGSTKAICRFKADSKVHAGIQAELEKTTESFKSFERKDIKLKEDTKHLKAKLKKLGDKVTKDTSKAEVRAGFQLWICCCLSTSLTYSFTG